MPNNVLLNNVDHKDIKVITERSAKYGDAIWYTMTFPLEFRSIQAHYPIFFIQEESVQKYVPVALFGFEDGENLFLSDDGWDATYIPLTRQRDPFLIGTQLSEENGEKVEKQVLSIDLDNPRVSTTEGSDLFLKFGANSSFLDSIADQLDALHFGVQQNMAFVDRITKLDLIEPFTLEVQLTEEKTHQMIGFFTINEDKLAQLDGETLESLNKEGFLQPIYMAIASQSHIQNLVERKKIKEN